MRRKRIWHFTAVVTGLSVLAGASGIFGIRTYAAPVYDSAYTKTYSLEELIRPALAKNTDARGVYRQLKLALQYGEFSESDINRLWFDSGLKIPTESMRLLYQDGLISSFGWKTFSGSPYVKEDFAGVFDASFYYNAYPDLQLVVGSDPDALFRHFLKYGMAEGRIASASFNVAAYRTANPALDALYGENFSSYYTHYLLFGRFAGA